MNELIQKNDGRATIRWKLLTGASAIVLAASISPAMAASAEDASQPQIWVELGAQLERAGGGDGPFVPDFYSRIDPAITSPGKIASELPWAFGPEGKISFQPEHSDWIFSAGVRYGRASNHRDTQQKTNPAEVQSKIPYLLQHYYSPGGQYYYFKPKCCHTHTALPPKENFADVESSHQETHFILDFQAGKDVGLGLFGNDSSSLMSAGVRFAQFQTRSDVSVKARTDVEHYNAVAAFWYYFLPSAQLYELGTRFRAYSLTAGSTRSFRGIGPSLSWDVSAVLAGNPDSSELTFDWGINAALLFGKQKAKTHHQSSGQYNPYGVYGGAYYQSLYNHPPKHFTRSRNVTVPNVGGMAGFSIKFPNAKISIGYRADYFFGAMDGGWDTYRKENRSFMGPFASISIGLGD